VGEHQFQTLAHGVIEMERMPPEYGKARRRIQISKLRGVDYHDGFHDCAIRRGGVVVYPRLVSVGGVSTGIMEKVSSSVPELDDLLAGGPERGTSMLIVGPAGVGKTTLCMQYAAAAARRNEHVAMYSFDERLDTMLARATGMGMELRAHIESGRLTAAQVDPAILSPGEFIGRVRHEVEQEHARLIVIDSLNGYLNAMPGERFLVVQMHELLTYLGEHHVLSLVVVPQHGLLGNLVEAPVDLSYLADSVLLLRYFEHAGRVRKAISAVKTRGGKHEDTIREYLLSSKGVQVGAPLKEFHGVLSGSPLYTGTDQPLLGEGGRRA
jgi:circadian clock protein KaiC